jgi:hypothetical protein
MLPVWGKGSRRNFLQTEFLPPFKTTSEEIFQKMPQIQNVSIFIQGPLWQQKCFQEVLDKLVSAAAEANVPFFIIRTPWRLLSWWPNDEESTRVLRRSDNGFRLRIFRTPLEPGGDQRNVVDYECGGERYWRVGSMFEPDGEDADGVIVTDYALCTPEYSKKARGTVLRSAKLMRDKFVRWLR